MYFIVVGYNSQGYAAFTVAVQDQVGVASVIKDLQSKGCVEFNVRIK